MKLAKLDQIVECFPNTLLKMLPGEISKTKWSKKAKEVLSWEDWWEMHEKVSQTKFAGGEKTVQQLTTSTA